MNGKILELADSLPGPKSPPFTRTTIMTAPYVLSQTSPRLVRLFFTRNPEAMIVFRNVVYGEPLGNKVFVDSSKSSLPDNDPIIEFMVEKMIQFSLLTRVGNTIEANYSDIVVRSDSNGTSPSYA
jgi:hypothetical protein